MRAEKWNDLPVGRSRAHAAKTPVCYRMSTSRLRPRRINERVCQTTAAGTTDQAAAAWRSEVVALGEKLADPLLEQLEHPLDKDVALDDLMVVQDDRREGSMVAARPRMAGLELEVEVAEVAQLDPLFTFDAPGEGGGVGEQHVARLLDGLDHHEALDRRDVDNEVGEPAGEQSADRQRFAVQLTQHGRRRPLLVVAERRQVVQYHGQ